MIQPEILQIYLVRHGATDVSEDTTRIQGRNTPTPLNQLGRIQAIEHGLAAAAIGIVPQVVLMSPAERAKETAWLSLAAMRCTLQPLVDDDLQEIHQGRAEGMLRDDFYDELTQARIRRDPLNYAADGGESILQTQHRMLRSVDRAARMLREVKGDTAMLYTHGFATRSVAGLIDGWPVERIRGEKTPNCSNTLIEVDRHSRRVVYVGQLLTPAHSVE